MKTTVLAAVVGAIGFLVGLAALGFTSPAKDRQHLPPAPIRDGRDLLHEVIKNLGPEQANELASTAAKEVLRIQAMQKEGEVERELLEGKVETTIDAVNRLADNPNVTIAAETHHKDNHGYTTVKVQGGPRPVVGQTLPKSGPCFVATACYGDYDHPTVLVLRRFRDLTLMATPTGRWFVDTYYRWGPTLARFIDRVPVVKPPVRLVLRVFAAAYSGVRPTKQSHMTAIQACR
jgi:hypothetical protein